MKQAFFCCLVVFLCCLCACTGQEPPVSSNVESRPESSASSSVASESTDSSVPTDTPPLEPTSTPTPEPVFAWTSCEPDSQGMDPSVLEAMHAALADTGIYALVTARNGQLVDEYYAEGYDENSVLRLNSATKSFTGAVVGIAVEEGCFGGVEDRLSDYLPQVLEQADAGKAEITLYDLLIQSSGLEWHEWGNNSSSWPEFMAAENWVDYILGQPLLYAPGTRFNYSTGNTHLLAAALEQAVGKTEFEYASEKLFGPLGIESAVWTTDPQGITDGGNGLSMTARDALRFGQLYLQNGVWMGKRLLSEEWLEQSTSVQTTAMNEGTGSYGYQWWIRSLGGYDLYYAMGAFGQFVFVVPELQLTAVAYSHCPYDPYLPRTFFRDYVLASVKG